MQNKFTEVANKITTIKTGFAEAISAKGVETAPNASFSDMIANVGNITGGGGGEEDIVVPPVEDWVKPHDWPNIEQDALKPNSLRILMCDAYDGGEQEIVFSKKAGQTYIQATINWGDGSPEDEILEIGSSYTIKHKFRKEGGTSCDRGYNTYVVNITLGDSSKNNLPNSIKFKKSGGSYSSLKYNNLLWVYADFTDMTTLTSLFGGVSDYMASPLMERVKYINTSKITSMYYAFFQCTDLVSIEAFDTSNVSNMSYAFKGCYRLQKLPSFDTSNVTSVSNMFENCYSLLDVSWLNVTSKVRDVSNAFKNCHSLIKLPKQLDLSNASSVNGIFYGCRALTYIPDLAFSTSITTLGFLFNDCRSLKKIPNLANTSKVTEWSYVFGSCSSISAIPETIDFSAIKEMNNLFYECSALTKIPELPFQQVTNADRAFFGCSSLKKLPSTLNLTQATKTASLLAGCIALTKVGDLETARSTDTGAFFDGCKALQEVGNLDFSGPTSYYSNYNHFNYCESLQKIGTIKLGSAVGVKIEKCPLTEISFSYDSSKAPVFTETVPIKINYTQLDKAALDKLMTQLPDGNGKTLDLKYNPGSATCDTSIATAKNWTVLV